ncbi:chromosome partition protein Smc-like [Haliotis rufescens]|uniref:chromosome partition protein Smc-like n=1 Tax=Haliotis rufescens TaxID=6454 RepID=UPI00201F5279|nr:chromosome partition protein Smc-like [Haliotis rufescens]
MARLVTEKGKMREDEEMSIRAYTSEIEEILEAKDITGTLFSKGILDFPDRQEIEACHSKIERAKRFLNTIVFRGPNAFTEFVSALKEKGYMDLADKLCQKNTADEIAMLIRDGRMVDELNKELGELKTRMKSMEITFHRTGATKRDIDSLKDGIENMSLTLEKIESLTKTSEETVSTINSMHRQLKQKDKELEAARAEIQKLKEDVLKLEKDNSVLRGELEKQRGVVENLNDEMEKMKEKNTALEKKVEDSQATFTEILRDQKKEMNEMKRTIQDISAQSKPLAVKPVKLAPRAIIPRNRFQKK